MSFNQKGIGEHESWRTFDPSFAQVIDRCLAALSLGLDAAWDTAKVGPSRVFFRELIHQFLAVLVFRRIDSIQFICHFVEGVG